MKKFVLFAIFSIAILGNSNIYAQEKENSSASQNKSSILGGWVTYEQLLGGLNNQFLTYGGVNAGISVLGISIGLGVYGTYPFDDENSIFNLLDVNIYYGGLVLGYKFPWKTIGFRISTILGAGSINIGIEDVFQKTTYHFVIAPSVNIDFHIYRSLVLSVGVTYRYFFRAEDEVLNINHWKNSLSGVLSLGWVY